MHRLLPGLTRADPAERRSGEGRQRRPRGAASRAWGPSGIRAGALSTSGGAGCTSGDAGCALGLIGSSSSCHGSNLDGAWLLPALRGRRSAAPRCDPGGPEVQSLAAPWTSGSPAPTPRWRDEASSRSCWARRFSMWILLTGSCPPRQRGEKPPLNVTWECGMLSRRSGLLQGGCSDPTGPVLCGSPSPWMDVFAGSLKRRKKWSSFLPRWRVRLEGGAILPAFPALPHLGDAAVARGGAPWSPGAVPRL